MIDEEKIGWNIKYLNIPLQSKQGIFISWSLGQVACIYLYLQYKFLYHLRDIHNQQIIEISNNTFNI